MTAKLHHTLLPHSAVVATTAATGYAASNVSNTEVGKPWRSTAITTTNLDIDLGTARTNPVLCIQHANAASCTVSHGSAAYTTTSAGTLTLSKDRHGRRKASLALVGSVRYVRLVFGAVAPDAGAAYFEVGSVPFFASTLTLPGDPLLGSNADVRHAQQRIELANGARVPLARGVSRQELALRFRSARTSDIDEMVRLARAQVCWLDLDISTNRELQWPVRHTEDRQERAFARATEDETSIALDEVA